MSHFSVLVIGDNVEEALAPYQENNMGDCPKEYLRFVDEEDDHLRAYQNNGSEKVIFQGIEYNTFSSELKELVALSLGYAEKNFFRSRTEEDAIRAEIQNLKPYEVKYNKAFATFEEYMSEWCGHKQRDEEMGRYGYWENPNAKWDWWRVGGRWCGYFKLKKGADKSEAKCAGPEKVFRIEPKHDADQAKRGIIDFEWLYNSNRLRAEKEWDKYLEACKTRVRKIEHRDQDTEFLPFDPDGGDPYWNFGVEKGDTKETFVRRNSSISTFAVVKDGQWYQKGEMGWWGIVHGEKDTECWDEQWDKLVMSLPDDTLLTVVDCHI